MRGDVNKPRRKISLEAAGTILGTGAAVAALSITFGAAWLMQRWTGQGVNPPVSDARPAVPAAGAAAAQLVRGRALFSEECASCHGKRAQGGFGPDLRHLEISRAQVAAAIKDGMKPGMPAFGRKYGDADVQALTQFVAAPSK